MLTYAAGKDRNWIKVGVGSSAGVSGNAAFEQLKLPSAFDSAMRSVMGPGTTWS